ncbi:hypothetical protein Rhe02_36430 [Rhizocola hellebori]|uniref:Uncharacterized protein n=1 Tax=Rhizocola hellebori TaxID=1392758 RepID=A0A8J3VH20_9ACTN|nr:hypothetical protein Rhe02_36430 [Rhizocola hellebori]
MLLALVTGITASAGPASAQPSIQALPSPLRFTSSLDLECFRTNPYMPPTTTVVTRHLNPVLANLPQEAHTLGLREKLCVPVAKNNMIPPAGVLEFVRFVDLSCYRITGTTVGFPLNLRHLNPLFQTLPPRNVVIQYPQHLCVPVIKNGLVPPAEILNLVRYIDLKCYFETPQAPLNIGVQLTHLNPVLGGLAPHAAGITFNRQLCVPVQKNNQPIPAATLNIIRWVDLEMFDIQTAPLANPFTLQIRHINPSLGQLPPETVVIQQAFQLGLPMAKNGLIPPTA